MRLSLNTFLTVTLSIKKKVIKTSTKILDYIGPIEDSDVFDKNKYNTNHLSVLFS